MVLQLPLAPAVQNIYLVSLNIQTLKLAPLLAQFLYSKKRLELPGIGSFILNSDAPSTGPEYSKQTSITSGDIRFESNPSIKESADLVAYISENTGKMKALAAADLDSHIQLALQFLNIGKPFLFEGIGTLTKIKNGNFDFVAGPSSHEKIKDIAAKETASVVKEELYSNLDPLSPAPATSPGWKKPVIALLVLAGLGCAVWGGYSIYKNSQKTIVAKEAEPEQKSEPIATDDTIDKPAQEQTIVETNIEQPNISPSQVTTSAPPGNYKFIVEVARLQRALERMNKLKGFGLDLKMETPDSVNYKLYFLLPATAADTARIRDSLRIIYTPSWSKAFVEQ